MSKNEPKQIALRPAEAARYLGVSRSTLYRFSENDATFPLKIRYSERCVVYLRTELDKWLNEKISRAA